MKILKFTLLAAMTLCVMAASAQKKGIKPLKIGDYVPGNIKIDTIVNDKYTSAHLSDFKDKLLILDFWYIGCGSCIAALPKAVTLPQQFGGRVKILPVTHWDNSKAVDEFMKTAGGKQWGGDLHGLTNIPSVAGDKILTELFPHYMCPYEIWILKGKVVAITAADYVTSHNIQVVLDGGGKDWEVEDAYIHPFDPKRTLLQINPSRFEANPDLRHYAAVFGYIANTGARMGSYYDPLKHLRRTYIINAPIINAYLLNWHKINDTLPMLLQPNRVILEVKDKSRYIKTGYQTEYDHKASICYESVIPDSAMTKKEQGEMIIRDLDNLLGLHARYEKRMVKCLALVRTGTDEKLKTAGGKSEYNWDSPVKTFKNVTLSIVAFQVENRGNPPTFDETGYKGNIDLDLRFDSWTDIEAIRKALQPYGLDLKVEEKELTMFVITETGYKGN
jgi:hypothetical protein